MFKALGHQSLLLVPPPAAWFISPFKKGHFALESLACQTLACSPLAFLFVSIVIVFGFEPKIRLKSLKITEDYIQLHYVTIKFNYA